MPFTEFYCDASTGSNLSAGSDAGSPTATYTNGGWNSGTGVFTPASGNPSTDGVTVGQFASIYSDGASAPTGFVGRITAVTTSTFTVSTTAKSGSAPSTAGSGITAVVGGAWKGPTGASGFPATFIQSTATNASGDPVRVNYKNNATYSITAAIAANNTVARTTHQGYTTTPGDGGKAVLDGGTSGASYNLLQISGGTSSWLDWVFQNNGATGSAAGVAVSVQCTLQRCVFRDLRGAGVTLSASARFVECEAYACNTSNTANVGGFTMTSSTAAYFLRCISHDHSGSNSSGFVIQASTQTVVVDVCIAESNGSHGFLCNAATPAGYVFRHCTAYNNGGDGMRFTHAEAMFYAENCVFVSNTGYGVQHTVTATLFPQRLVNCGFFGNGSGETSGVSTDAMTGTVSFSAAPLTDPGTGNFAVTSAQGQGTGRGSFTQTVGYTTTTTSAPDLGAVQAAGGSASAVYSSFQIFGRRDYRRTVTRLRTVPLPVPTIVVQDVVHPVVVPQRRLTPQRVNRLIPQVIPGPATVVDRFQVIPGPNRHYPGKTWPGRTRYLTVREIVVQTTVLPLVPRRRAYPHPYPVPRPPQIVVAQIVQVTTQLVLNHPRVVR